MVVLLLLLSPQLTREHGPEGLTQTVASAVGSGNGSGGEREREVLSVFLLLMLTRSLYLSLSPSLCSLEFVIKTGDNNGDYCE